MNLKSKISSEVCRKCLNIETIKALVTSVKKRMRQKLTSLLWSAVAIVTSTSLSSADIFTSSSDLNYLLYSTSIEMPYFVWTYSCL